MQNSRVIIDTAAYLGTNRGIADIRIAQSATTAAGVAVWSLRNKTAGKKIYISRIWMQLWQSGTGAATEMQYEWKKGTGCTVQSAGATAVTPLLKRTAHTNPDVEVHKLDTGLTQTGVTLGAAFFNCVWARITHSATAPANSCSGQFTLDLLGDPIELLQNEVLTLLQCTTSVIGDSVSGGVEFYGG